MNGSELFDRYVSHGTTTLEIMCGFTGKVGALADQIRDMAPDNEDPAVTADAILEYATLDVARQIHNEVCDCDDKTCTITDEIVDWLAEGDYPELPVDQPTIEALIAEWQESNEQ